MSNQDQRFVDAQAMSTDELRAAVRRLGVTPKGGLSRATRRDLINWYVINTPRRRLRTCDHMNENGPHPWNLTVCGRPADERSAQDSPRCAQHLTDGSPR